MEVGIIYNIEIVAVPPKRGEECLPGIKYCEGWQDYENMGISCICAYELHTGNYRVFLEDNFSEFQKLVDQCTLIIGFNSERFDDRVCRANGLRVTTTYDLLLEAWSAAGLNPYGSFGAAHKGFKLEDLAQANFGFGKSGEGANAAVLWQRGKFGQVIDYCLRDVRLTFHLWERRSNLVLPRGGYGSVITLREPYEDKRVFDLEPTGDELPKTVQA